MCRKASGGFESDLTKGQGRREIMGWASSVVGGAQPVFAFCRNAVPVPAALFCAQYAQIVHSWGLTGGVVVRYALNDTMNDDRDYIYDIRSIGIRIRLLRELKHVTQKELGETIGLSRERFSKAENGNKGLSPEIMMRLADYFEVPLEFLYFGRVKDVRLKDQLLEVAKVLCLLAGEKKEQ